LQKINSSLKIHKKSLIWLAGVAGLMFITSYIAEKDARNNVFGADSK
jgi:hypothetical protein